MSSTYNPPGSSNPGALPGSTSESNTSQSDYSKLQEEIASLKDQLTKIVSTAGSEAAKSVHSMASQVSDAASGAMDTGAKMANSAADQAKTFASEIEVVTRKKPLGAIAAALCVGVLIGLVGRGHR